MAHPQEHTDTNILWP